LALAFVYALLKWLRNMAVYLLYLGNVVLFRLVHLPTLCAESYDFGDKVAALIGFSLSRYLFDIRVALTWFN